LEILTSLFIGSDPHPNALWKAYSGVLPSKPHRAVGKEMGETNHKENKIVNLPLGKCYNVL